MIDLDMKKRYNNLSEKIGVKFMKLGIDVGSTTIKCVVLDDENNVIFDTYRRHFSHVKENTLKIIKK